MSDRRGSARATARSVLKRAAPGLTVAAIGAAGLVAAGSALGPYRPQPIEFELAAPEGPGGRAPRLSSPLEAPKRFNMVALRWSGAGRPSIEIRVRGRGGPWSPWTAVPFDDDHGPDPGEPSAAGSSARGAPDATRTSAPVWAGEADELQYRASRPPGALRFELVNTSGTATAGERARTAVERGVRGALAALPGVAGARAQGGPTIVPRDEWAGDHCRPRTSPVYGEVEVAFIHHTASANRYSREQARAMVLGICRLHRGRRGWGDIGYNFLVDRYGTVYEGRAGGFDRAVRGAQVRGLNAESTGIALLGTHAKAPPTEAALKATAALVRWKLLLHGQPTTGEATITSAGGEDNRFPRGTEAPFERISAHRDGTRTGCPGDSLYARLGRLRAMVGSFRPRGAPTTAEAAASPPTLTVRAPAALRGAVRASTGGGLASAPVEAQHLGPYGWETFARTLTDERGRFGLRFRSAVNVSVRAHFPGRRHVALPSSSRSTNVFVRPRLSLRAAGARVDARRPAVVSGLIEPAKRRVAVVVERVVAGGTSQAATLTADARRGRFRVSYSPPSPGRYRFQARLEGDDASLAARSRAVEVVVHPPPRRGRPSPSVRGAAQVALRGASRSGAADSRR